MNISSRFTSNSETNASELLENLEECFFGNNDIRFKLNHTIGTTFVKIY